MHVVPPILSLTSDTSTPVCFQYARASSVAGSRKMDAEPMFAGIPRSVRLAARQPRLSAEHPVHIRIYSMAATVADCAPRPDFSLDSGLLFCPSSMGGSPCQRHHLRVRWERGVGAAWPLAGELGAKIQQYLPERLLVVVSVYCFMSLTCDGTRRTPAVGTDAGRILS